MLDAVPSLLNRYLHTTLQGAVEFALVAAALIAAAPTPRSLACGALVSALGLALRLWVTGYGPKQEAFCGPLRWLRHPHQMGSALLFLGVCLASRSAWVTAGAMIALAALHARSQQRADEQLAGRLGPGFAAYRVQVPALLPRLWPYSSPQVPGTGGFTWEQALLKGRHRELDAVLAALSAWAVLYGLSLTPQQERTHLVVALVVLVSIVGRFVYYAGSRRARR